MTMTNMGIVIRVGPGANDGPPRSKNVSQSNPRRKYVYAHKDRDGQIFYIGKGTGKRAWSVCRDPLWHHYVERYLGNQYSVEILLDNMNEEEALFAESQWIAHLGPQLVNWSNPGRDFDMDALRLFHERRNANRELIKEARATEKTDLESAVGMYIRAIEAIPTYETLVTERGLVAKLQAELYGTTMRFGAIAALERLVMCLIKLGRIEEAAERAKAYFAVYEGDRHNASERIGTRIEKAFVKRKTT